LQINPERVGRLANPFRVQSNFYQLTQGWSVGDNPGNKSQFCKSTLKGLGGWRTLSGFNQIFIS
jgi:hypothetical protein